MASSFDELNKQACPEGVPRVPLGSVGTFTRGSGLQKADLQNEGFPAIHYGQIHTIYHHAIDSTCKFVSEDKADGFKKAQTGDIVLATTSEDDEAVGKAVAWLGDGEVAVSGDAVIYSHKLDPAYVSYFFECSDFQYEKLRYISGAKVRRISPKSLEKILIPHPPLEVQQEIVRILDLFVDLDRELEQEIIGREKQFVSTRDALLDSLDYPTEKFGDKTTVARGASPRPIRNFITNDPEGIPWIKIGDVPEGDKYITQTAQKVTQAGADKSRMVYPGDFMLSNSMSFGRPYITRIEGAIHDGWLSISNFEETWTSDFLYHVLSSEISQRQFRMLVGSGAVSNLNAKVVQKTEIPVPPLEVQEEIASKLDTFIEYIDNLKRERELRQKQYAHYRDLLLDLPVKE